MTDKTIAALQYLYSTLDFSEQQSFTFSLDIDGTTTQEVEVIQDNGECLIGQEFVINPDDYHLNPIQNMIDAINKEMCLDCLSIDYLLKDPFFLSLIDAYIESLFIEFGSEASISKDMAYALFKNKLTEYNIYYAGYEDYVLLNEHNIDLFDTDEFIITNV